MRAPLHGEGAHHRTRTPEPTIALSAPGWKRDEAAMNALTAWTFPTPEGADTALERLQANTLIFLWMEFAHAQQHKFVF